MDEKRDVASIELAIKEQERRIDQLNNERELIYELIAELRKELIEAILSDSQSKN